MKLKILFYLKFGLLILGILAFTNKYTTTLYFEVPKGFPKPIYDFKNNPLTQEGFELGRKLFYDPILSKDSTISCASCHMQKTGFTQVDHNFSHGFQGKFGTRNSLTLQNLAWNKNFMWDGGINHLEVQAIAPISSEIEMNETLENVVTKLNNDNAYSELFQKAFGTKNITGQLTLKAISQFVVSLTTSNSKYDQMIRKEIMFTEMEQKGYDLFKTHCASCHIEPLFTNNSFENNGLAIDNSINDFGRMKITQNPNDSLKFKVPTLRNVQFTFPYMHDGRFKRLTEVIQHYNSQIQNSKTLSEKLANPMNLADNQIAELVIFLKTLTDNDFLNNPRFSYPKQSN